MVLETSLVNLALVILAATVLAFLAKKARQPTVTAYILAGLLLGSAGAGIVTGGESISLLSELGLAFLLFLIGLEIRVDEIRKIARPVTIIAVSQMALVAATGFLLAWMLGFSMVSSLFIAGAVMYSSTAVVVKLLSDRDEISSLPGKLDVGMLLIEDLAVVLLLALIGTGAGSPARIALSIAEIFLMAGAVAALSILSSRYLLPRVFEKIADNRHAFFTHGIAWLFLMVTVTRHLGISMEIGAFFAGLSLAQLPYSQELQERVRPLTDFFMAIFFINIGLGLDR
ncbi:MAG: cation:proton antiporter, partial [Candidatus Nanohaloarchaea archaeon]